jgi:hypothetical protein
VRAVVRRALTDHDLLDRRFAVDARLPAAPVHGEGLLKITWLAVATHEVPKRRASGADRVIENVFDTCSESVQTLTRDAAGRTTWMNARSEERFIRIDIADARYDTAIHYVLLDCDSPCASSALEVLSREIFAERFGT